MQSEFVHTLIDFTVLISICSFNNAFCFGGSDVNLYINEKQNFYHFQMSFPHFKISYTKKC